jgi:hypothetical protein
MKAQASFMSPGIIVHRHAALSKTWGGLLPSDYLPVSAELEQAQDKQTLLAGVEHLSKR